MPLSDDLPPLRDAVLIAAFEGWNDAGDAASGAVEHLLALWQPQVVGRIEAEGFYDFQVNRPTVRRVAGRREITWPDTTVYAAAAGPDSPLRRDVVIVLGVEPSTHWRAYVAELLEAAAQLGVTTVVTLGALLANVPHTRPIPVSTTSDDPDLQRRHDAQASDYEGPTGIVGVLSQTASERGLPALSCWAAVPHYAGGPPSPKATLALLHRLEAVLDMPLPLGDLADRADDWERGVDELADSDDEVADYVQSLEAVTDAAEAPEPSGDELAREFERYLRRRDDHSEGH